jgi:hypothetical protein
MIANVMELLERFELNMAGKLDEVHCTPQLSVSPKGMRETVQSEDQ